MSYDRNIADCEASLADLAAIVNSQGQKLIEANKEIANWRVGANDALDCAQQLAAKFNQANKLLERTIEVLETWNDYEGCTWWFEKAKPLLDNLKALKKEGTE